MFVFHGAMSLGLLAEDLSCIRRDRILFEHLTVSLTAGQLIYLRGPNGAGKTSLLRILTGLTTADSGSVSFEGTDIATDTHAYYANLIYLGHKPGLNSTLSAIENLRFWLAQQQCAFDLPSAYAALEKVGLVGMEDIPVRLLSAGQQRRVALTKLWLKPAKIWILDEPFTSLDSQGITLLEKEFARHVRAGGMLLTTSHQPLSPLAGPTTVLDLEYQI